MSEYFLDGRNDGGAFIEESVIQLNCNRETYAVKEDIRTSISTRKLFRLVIYMRAKVTHSIDVLTRYRIIRPL